MAINRAALVEKCAILEAALIQSKLGTRAAFDRARPKGRDGRSEGPWFLYYTQLIRLDEQRRQRDQQQQVSRSDERVLMDAQRNLPEMVDLAQPLPAREAGGVPQARLPVYPKSLTALLEMHYWDHECELLGPYLVWLRGSSKAEDLRLYRTALERLGWVQRLQVWILSTGRVIAGEVNPHACPYPHEARYDPQVPAWLDGLDPLDAVRMLQTHVRVNQERLLAVHRLTRSLFAKLPQTNARASWSLFANGQADDLGIAADEVNDRWPMMAVIARAAMKAKASLEAQEARKPKVAPPPTVGAPNTPAPAGV